METLRDFELFTEAIASAESSSAEGEANIPALKNITVLGGGGDGLLLSLLCMTEGAEVTLFSAYGEEMNLLENPSGISVRGAGPIGNYVFNRKGVPSIKTTARIDEAVRGAQVIFLTGPTYKQRIYSMVLPGLLKDGQILVLAPGRTFGIVEVLWLLKSGDCNADCTLVEILGLPYWHSLDRNQLTLSKCPQMLASALPNKKKGVLNALERYLPNITPAKSVLHTAFQDGSGLVEATALMFGGCAMEKGGHTIPDGASPLPENETFLSLIGKDHQSIIRKLSDERIMVARKFGIMELPGAEEWIKNFAGSFKGDGARPIPSVSKAKDIVRCATTGSLIPLASAAKLVGVSVPTTSAVISCAGSMLGIDVNVVGRKLETLGFNADNIENLRRMIDENFERRK